MIKFSANLGFLWQELTLPEAIKAAADAGFDAVECHWPYAVPVAEVNAVLAETRLSMIGLNSSRGNTDAGENGLCALPERIDDARKTVDEAIEYAAAINTGNIHVLAGFAEGEKAHDTFVSNLQYATSQAAADGITILIEPLNHYDAPGYFLQTSKQALKVIEDVGATNIKLMFDCYHLQIMEGDLTRKIHALAPVTGHIQIASIPARSEPDCGELNYAHVLSEIERSGYTGYIGAEYKPLAGTKAGLGWMQTLRS
ncbi:MAG: TIM barrel protein [Granulosicoccus sp.]|nr:TIM barrel protein [Granulosicoccus sp.]